MKNNGHNLHLYFFLLLTIIGLNVLLSASAISQCKLSMTVNSVPVQQLSLADVDFENFSGRTLLFTLRIINNDIATARAQLRLTINIALANGKIYEPALKFYSEDSLNLPSGSTILTNLNLGKLISEPTQYKDEVKTNILDVALATGKFPSGRYSYSFSIFNEKCDVSSPSIVVTLENISRIELRSPRDGEVTNEFPLFEFFHDGNKAELTVAEKSSDQSREDAISREPAMTRIELIGQNSFLYSGGRPLEQGKTYVWKVVGKTLGPGGTEIEVPSPIGLFKVSSSEQAGSEDALLKILEELFGSRYPAIFEQIHNGDFNLTGMNTLNGTVISQGDLLKLFNELRQINDNVELSFE